MSGKVVVLGAKGRFGRAAVNAFGDAGWRVRALARSWAGEAMPAGAETIAGDAFNAGDLRKAVAGCEVIVNALNPPYPRWSRDLPRLTANVVEAAKASGATVTIPGNVYNYGEAMPRRLAEDTPHAPTTRKGRLREDMELAYAGAAMAGVQTIILRAGDFIEREKTGNWFDSHIAAKIATGRVMYPGPLDRVHAWAYLPDTAAAMVGLAGIRSGMSRFEEFGFPGYALTGRDLITAMERACGRRLRIKGLAWPMIRALGLINPDMREVAEMSYLWRTAHAFDGAKLATALPDFHLTPLESALAEVLSMSAIGSGQPRTVFGAPVGGLERGAQGTAAPRN